jgi:hypothetical protein
MVMNEIYWITTLGHLRDVAYTLSGLAIAITIVGGIILLLCGNASDLDDDEVEAASRAKLKKITVSSAIAGFILVIAMIFIPSKQDMYLIYGAGNVIDYCQGNPKVKELPDKAVEALNTWLDMINEKEE